MPKNLILSPLNQKRLKTPQNSQLIQTQLHLTLPRQQLLLCRKYLRQKHNKLNKHHNPMITLHLSQQPPVLDLISQTAHRLHRTATFASKITGRLLVKAWSLHHSKKERNFCANRLDALHVSQQSTKLVNAATLRLALLAKKSITQHSTT